MKALLLSRYCQLEIVEVPKPQPGQDEVLIRVAACGICGSDVYGYGGSSGRRIPPIVMGHEAAGTIAALGYGVTRFALGERVTFDSTVFCGNCPPCLRGEINLCDHRQVLGVSCSDYRRAGAFAEYIAVPSRIVYALPQNLSFTEAAMLEAVSVAVHAVSLVGTVHNKSTLVVGAGMIGLLCAQVLRASGASRVFVSDIDGSRIKLAESLGLAAILTGGKNAADQIVKYTDGVGVDIAIEAVGTTETVNAAIESARKGGTVVLVGNISREVTIPLQEVVTRQIRLQGSCASAREYPRAMDLLASGTVQVKSLITAVASLDEGPRWFQRLHDREPNLMKVVLAPGAIS